MLIGAATVTRPLDGLAALLPIVVWVLSSRAWRGVPFIVLGGLPLTLLWMAFNSSLFGSPFEVGYFPVAPAVVIVTARAWHGARAWARSRTWSHFHAAAGLYACTSVVLVWGAIGVFPIRLDIYRSNLLSLKLHPEVELRDMGVERALVLVPTSWGNRIIADLWSLGARPGVVERAYRTLDACTLDEYRHQARAERWSGQRLEQASESAARDATPTPLVDGWPDPTLRLIPERVLSSTCDVEVRRDLAGFTFVEALVWRNPIEGDGIVFAHDLHERNDELRRAHPDPPVWRYVAPPDGLPRLVPVAEPIAPARGRE